MVCGLPILRLRREKLLHEAERVLRTPEAARAWLKTANEALGGRAPEDLVETLDGFEQALAELEDQASPLASPE